jgi:hypothetical protein
VVVLAQEEARSFRHDYTGIVSAITSRAVSISLMALVSGHLGAL